MVRVSPERGGEMELRQERLDRFAELGFVGRAARARRGGHPAAWAARSSSFDTMRSMAGSA